MFSKNLDNKLNPKPFIHVRFEKADYKRSKVHLEIFRIFFECHHVMFNRCWDFQPHCSNFDDSHKYFSSVILFTLSPPNKSKSSYILELSINTAAVCIVVKTYDIANWIEGITTNRLLALGYLARRAQGFIRQQKGDDKPKQTGTT